MCKLLLYFTETEPKRINLTTMKDIRNIEKSFGMNIDGQKHNDDATSVKLWVEEMKAQGESNPVLFYDHNDKSDDFIIVLQSTLQAEMLKHLASQKVVCIDDTHGTNAYNFYLSSLMVIDEFGEGFVVAWSICNKNDTVVLQRFFEAIKGNVGEIDPLWFMSDDADQFYNAWIGTFQYKPKRILCSWHVLRAWRKHLRSISNYDKEEEVYQILKVLMDETDLEKFKLMQENAIRNWKTDNSTTQFAEYFESQYKSRYSQWAACCRLSSGVNTNMFVEAFHHVLKYKFLKGVKNKRVDALIHSLLEYLRFKSFDRLIKFEKGKVTGRISLIQKRHTSSKSLSPDSVSIINSTTWEIQSENGSNVYVVEKASNDCSDHCALNCKECNICVHTFNCTCPDSQIYHTICKHVHLVVRQNTIPQHENRDTTYTAMQVQKLDHTLQTTLVNEISTHPNVPLDLIKSRVLLLIQDITNQVESSSSLENLKAAEKFLFVARNNLSADVTSIKPKEPLKNEPANTKIEKQRPFKKTNKKVNPEYVMVTLLETNDIKFKCFYLGYRQKIRVFPYWVSVNNTLIMYICTYTADVYIYIL